MYRAWAWPTIWAIAVILSISPDVRGGFEITSSSVSVDSVSKKTTFVITFSQPPDFYGADDLGRPNNAFQYFYDSEPGGFEFAGEDIVIIRGPEIRFDNKIPIRESENPTGENYPNAEGWGKLRGGVDFTIDGSTLKFTAPWNVLKETDRRFSYRLIATQRGEETSDVTRVMIPLHPAVWGGLGLLGCAWIAKRSFGRRLHN